MATDDDYTAAFSAALQVAAINGVRGLLAAETELNPEVAGICCVLDGEGHFEVTALDGAGRPVAGYRA